LPPPAAPRLTLPPPPPRAAAPPLPVTLPSSIPPPFLHLWASGPIVWQRGALREGLVEPLPLNSNVSSVQSKSQPQRRGEYNVYSTFQSHEPEFDYLKSLEIEEKINKIRWLPQQNAAYFLLSTNDIVDIKPSNMEELTEVITAAEFHPQQCQTFAYSSSKGSIRLCDMRQAALCDKHCKSRGPPSTRVPSSSEMHLPPSLISATASRLPDDQGTPHVKVWDLHAWRQAAGNLPVHDYLRGKLCSLYENDCIFDKFECVWNGSDSVIMTGSYNNFFRMFDRNTKRDVTLEASRENSKPRAILKPRKVCVGGKRRKDEISVDSLDFSKKILHTTWHPQENIIAVAATNNLYIFQDKVN
ncbi:LOW QUALITY PROTEIN: hypothetical protein CRUP_009890, partial [Coryphaenoides rupestris]